LRERFQIDAAISTDFGVFFIDTDNFQTSASMAGSKDGQLAKVIQVRSSIAALRIVVCGRGRPRDREMREILDGIKLTCISKDEETASALAILATGVGVQVEGSDPAQYEVARKAQEREFGQALREKCLQPKLRPEQLGMFLQPEWHT
jgi:hypothetical protein